MKALFILMLLPLPLYAHEAKLEAVEVIEHEDSQGLLDFVPSVTKLKGSELRSRRQTSIGDTLRNEAGVESTYFGPSASRPVIRGLDGDRIRVLQNSLGTLDASAQSLDHAIPVDTLTIDQMEIVRGPMSLLYGSSAVGGVVNLVTNRIHYEFEEGFFSKILVQGETVNNGLSSAAHLNYGANKWMFHLDGSTRNLGDIEVPGNGPDKLANSFNKQDNVATAVSKIFERGYVGLSFNHFNTLYGSVADEEVKIDMTQNRFELHSEYRPENGSVRKWKLKSAQSDYFHKELEGEETGTVFKNKGNESRLEAITKSDNWNGITGVHTQVNGFSAKGEEAFLPSTDTTKIALFTFQQLSLTDKHALRLGGRIESSEVDKEESAEFGASDESDFLSYNASIGHCFDFTKDSTIETSLSYTERAPTFQELYSNGEHVATGTFEVGDTDLTKEKATALEVTYKETFSENELTASVYAQDFKNYIALSPTGGTSGGVPVFAYEQVDALFYGFDVSNRSKVATLSRGALFFITRGDFVNAKDKDSGDYLPRISPPRITLGLDYVSNKWSADLESQYAFHQTRTAPNETTTDDYILTNAGYTYHVVGNLSSLDLFFRVRNIFNVEARSHVSPLKEIAPLPGRNFIAGAQFQF